MTQNNIVIEDLVELINEHGGIDSFSKAFALLINKAMNVAEFFDAGIRIGVHPGHELELRLAEVGGDVGMSEGGTECCRMWSAR